MRGTEHSSDTPKSRVTPTPQQEAGQEQCAQKHRSNKPLAPCGESPKHSFKPLLRERTLSKQNSENEDERSITKDRDEMRPGRKRRT